MKKTLGKILKAAVGSLVTVDEPNPRVFSAYLPSPDNRLVCVREITTRHFFENTPKLFWFKKRFVIRDTQGPLCVCPDCDQELVDTSSHDGTLEEALALAVADIMVAYIQHDEKYEIAAKA